VPQRRSKTWLVAFSLLLFGCGSGPKIDICVSDPANSGFQCVNKKGKSYFLPYDQSSNWLALSPDDAELLFNYCKQKGK
jgi:hypothetical protein